MRTIESMIEECTKELQELRKHWLKKFESKHSSRPYHRRSSSSFDFFFDNRERSIELGAVLAYLRLKRSQCYDELEGEDSEMV